MSKQMKEHQKELMSIMFNWRKGFDAATQENVLQAENEFGQFFILWQDDEEFTVVIRNDISGGDQFPTMEEAKDFCLQFVRGIMMRNLVTYFILGVTRGDNMKSGFWNQDHIIAFINDQFFNQYSPLTVEGVTTLLSNMREEAEANGVCPCERCQSIFGEEDDETLPGDPDAMPDNVVAIDTKKPTLH